MPSFVSRRLVVKPRDPSTTEDQLRRRVGPDYTVRHAVHSVDRAYLRAMEAEAAARTGPGSHGSGRGPGHHPWSPPPLPPYVPDRVGSYLTVDFPPGAPVDSILADLRRAKDSDRNLEFPVVYEQPLVVPPPGPDDLVAVKPEIAVNHPRRWNPSPKPNQPNGNTARIAVIEAGWGHHPALERKALGVLEPPRPVAIKAWGVNHPEYWAHGTATLSVLAGQGTDDDGVEGMLPRIQEPIRVFGALDEDGNNAYVAALWRAIFSFVEFDTSGPFPKVASVQDRAIILLEIQGQLMSKLGRNDADAFRLAPAEVDPLIFRAIHLATALGITVIEPAGNGGIELDAYVTDNSGAIMVGARSIGPLAKDVFGHVAQTRGANRGARIDVCGPGNSLRAASYRMGFDDADLVEVIIDNYGHTSAASAIVTGVAACLVAEGKGPYEIRSDLRQASEYTASGAQAVVDIDGVS